MSRVIGLAALAATGLALVLGLVVAPEAAIQGESQRLMYVHVPSAWTAFASFGVVGLCSAAVLLRRPGHWGAVALAAGEVGVVATGLTLAEGSLWGHMAWGTWWAWDPRLVSTALLFLSYLGYLAMRGLPGDAAEQRAAAAGLLFLLEIPVVHFSVLWWPSLHQQATILRPSLTPPIEGRMFLALMVALLASTLGAAWYVMRRTDQLVATPAAEPVVDAPAPEVLR